MSEGHWLDLDVDGDLDILYAHGDFFAWSENLGNGRFAAARPSHGYAPANHVADLDNDGDTDLFTGCGWHEWQDSRFIEHRFQNRIGLGCITVSGAPAFRDLDKDSYLDVMFAARSLRGVPALYNLLRLPTLGTKYGWSSSD